MITFVKAQLVIELNSISYQMMTQILVWRSPGDLQQQDLQAIVLIMKQGLSHLSLRLISQYQHLRQPLHLSVALSMGLMILFRFMFLVSSAWNKSAQFNKVHGINNIITTLIYYHAYVVYGGH